MSENNVYRWKVEEDERGMKYLTFIGNNGQQASISQLELWNFLPEVYPKYFIGEILERKA